MNEPWAAHLPLDQAPACSHLRLRVDVEFATSGATLWLRGENLDADIDLALRRIPGLTRYRRLDDELLAPIGQSVPVATLPGGAGERAHLERDLRDDPAPFA